MIFTERTIMVVNDRAKINKPLILYRGDKNIELKITIVESQFKFRSTGASNVIETTDASYAQLVINTPYNSPIFSEVTATENGAVIFVISEAMIDEIREVGIYDIQIRLFDDSKQSRVTIPPVNNAIEIKEPMAIEDGSVVDSNCTGIVLSADTLSFTTTDAQTLSVTVSPENCTDTITWSVSPTGIVTVNFEYEPSSSKVLILNGVVTPISNGTCTITATCGNYSDTCAVTVSGMSDYTDISYIESTGTQYINTRIGPTASTKIELVAEMSASKAYDHIFGSDIFMKAQWLDDTGTAIEAVKKNGQNQVSELTLGKHTYVMDMTDTANAITIDGTNYGSNIGHVESTNCSLLLLSGYSGDGTIETEFCGIGKIYSCKIYYEDTLVANMKPVLTKSGAYGLLDTVNNTFYASEVGNFTGPVPK